MSDETSTTELELSEIQGLILSGYGERPAARFALFQVIDAALTRRWLADVLRELQFGEFRGSARGKPPFLNPVCANIAFTHEGLRILGLHPTALAGMSPLFQEGMCEPNRARRLGDDGESAPQRWVWGCPGQPLHGLLAVYAGKETADQAEWDQIQAFIDRHVCAAHGIKTLFTLDSTALDQTSRKEHFGFRDGIANPGLLGLSQRATGDMLKPGEILLGYENGYGHLPLSPEIPAEADPHERLPVSPENEERRDFGKNGSYLVFRQLSQKVQEFWEFAFREAARIPGAPAGRDGAIWLASKLVGRWPNGTALTLFPERPGPEEQGDNDEFDYGPWHDGYGTRCPIGSHIRRSNPRDTTLPIPHDPEISGAPENTGVRKARVRLADLHRIMRRGRLYGPPLNGDFDPAALRAAPRDGIDRGLHFLCFNANLSRQFEFIQSNWVNNPCFAGLSRDPDPLLSGDREYPFRASDFTIPGMPPRRVRGVPRVVEVRGGAYFFMPSRAALKYLSEQ